MSVAEIKASLEALTVSERKEIAEVLVRLELRSDEGYWDRIRRRREDNDPDHWIPLQDLLASEE